MRCWHGKGLFNFSTSLFSLSHLIFALYYLTANSCYVARVLYCVCDPLPLSMATCKCCYPTTSYLLVTWLLMFVTFEHVNSFTQNINPIMIIVYRYYDLVSWTLSVNGKYITTTCELIHVLHEKCTFLSIMIHS